MRRLIKFISVVKDASGKLQSGPATLTFSLYEEQESGVPLWVETHGVQLDELNDGCLRRGLPGHRSFDQTDYPRWR